VTPLAFGLVVVADAVVGLTGPATTLRSAAGLVGGLAAVGVGLGTLTGRSGRADADGPALAALLAAGAVGLVLGVVAVAAG
jgi:hypothetical protein